MRIFCHDHPIPKMSSIIIVVETTVDQKEQADRLAMQAVAEGRAACSQISGPVTSHYIWKGKQEVATEHRIQFKVASAKLNSFVDWLLQQHPFDCPQILCWSADSCNPEYTSWVNGE